MLAKRIAGKFGRSSESPDSRAEGLNRRTLHQWHFLVEICPNVMEEGDSRRRKAGREYHPIAQSLDHRLKVTLIVVLVNFQSCRASIPLGRLL